MKFTSLLPLLMLLACEHSADIELHFETVEKVRLSALPARWPSTQNVKDVKQDEIILLRVKFSSPIDIVEYAKGKTLHVSMQAYHCSGGRVGEPIFVLPNLPAKDNLGVIGLYTEQAGVANSNNLNGRFLYDALVPVAGHELQRLFNGVSTPDKIPFLNAMKLNDEICIQLIAAGMWVGPSIRSNVIVVPNASIKYFFDNRSVWGWTPESETVPAKGQATKSSR